MAYCPRCEREQRCGCETCHVCGAALVETPVRTATRPAGVREGGRPPPAGSRVSAETPRGERSTPGYSMDVLPLTVLILGAALLLVSVISMIRAGTQISAAESVTSFPAIAQRVGYYLGHVLYGSVTRLIAAIALLALGLFMRAPGPFGSAENWRAAARGFAALTVALGACFCMASALLIIPGGYQGLYVSNLLPPLWSAVTIMVITGASLLATGYLVLVRGAPSAEGGRKQGIASRDGRAGGESLAEGEAEADQR